MNRFETREALVRAILEDPHWYQLRGYECPRCHRLLLRVVSGKLTAFSCIDEIELPAGVELDVETHWGSHRETRSEEDEPPLCPVDQTAMVRLSRSKV